MGDDALRPLSELGHAKPGAVGEALKERARLSMWCLPARSCVRRETTEGLLAGLGAGEQRLCDLLEAGSLRRRGKLAKFLAASGEQSLAVVGHDPDLSAFLAWLVGTEPEQVPLEKGGVALVRFEDGLEKGKGFSRGSSPRSGL